jgi:hypothetical protein
MKFFGKVGPVAIWSTKKDGIKASIPKASKTSKASKKPKKR